MGKGIDGKELGVGICQKKDGRYHGRYVNRFGKRKSLYSESLKELRDRLNTAIYEDKMKLNLEDEKLTLDGWYEKWLEVYKYNIIRESTKLQYKSIYEKHIQPKLGKQMLFSIKQLYIKQLLKELDMNGLKYETQNKVRLLLNDMFNRAILDNFAISNPAKGIKIKREQEVQCRVLLREEQKEFFECSLGTFYHNLFVVEVSTGLRPGEAYALKWEDIDLAKNLISISKTLLYQKLEGDSKKTFRLGQPKTKNSNRKIPINKQCREALLKQKRQQEIVMSKLEAKPIKGFEDLLFTTKYGTPINAEIQCDAIQNIVQQINMMRNDFEQMEMFSGHCLRHTFASRCFEAQIQPKTVQQYLGHATLQMTMDLYTHVLEEYKIEEIDKLDELYDMLNK